jgi:hypothetical protein
VQETAVRESLKSLAIGEVTPYKLYYYKYYSGSDRLADMTALESLSELQKLRADNAHWMEFAFITNEILGNASWKDGFASQTDYMIKASEASGYGIGTIRRFFKLGKIIDVLVHEYFADRAETNKIPMASLEVLDRMGDIDSAAAANYFPSLILGQISYRQLLKIYKDLIESSKGENVSAGKVGLRAAKNFDRSATEILAWNYKELSGDEDLEFVRQPKQTKYCKVDAISVKKVDDNIVFVDGYKFITRRSENITYQHFKMLEHLAFQAGFFRNLWVGFQKETGKQLAMMLMEDASFLGLKSIGIFFFDENFESPNNSSVEILSSPSGPPVPNWQSLYICEL